MLGRETLNLLWGEIYFSERPGKSLAEKKAAIQEGGYAFFERERLRNIELKYLSSHIWAYKAPARLFLPQALWRHTPW